MRKVMIVVPVLTINCHVLLKSKIGPVSAQARMPKTAIAKAIGRPVARAALFAKRVNHELDFIGRMRIPPERSPRRRAAPPGIRSP